MMIMTLDRRAITTRRLAASGISISHRITGKNEGGGNGHKEYSQLLYMKLSLGSTTDKTSRGEKWMSWTWTVVGVGVGRGEAADGL
jgi:hypothetical protein